MKSLFRFYRPDMQATFKLSYPIVVGQLGMVLMGVADTVMVGKLGAAELGAAGIVNSVFMLIAIIGIGTLSVVAPQIATAKGKHNYRECSALLRSGIGLSFLFGFLLALVMLVLYFNFDVFRQEREINHLAKPFLLIVGSSLIPMLLFTAAKQFCDGLSYTRAAMYITIAGLATNVFLNWLLIFGNWGFPAWGLNGAGVATLLARIFMAIGMLVYIWQVPYFRVYTQPLRPHDRLRPLMERIIRLGLPGGMQYFFEVAAFSGAAIITGWLGKYPLAAHQIAINLASITYMMASGISTAGSIRVGEAVGLNNRSRVLRAGTAALLLTALFMSFSCILFLSARQMLIHLYITDPQVVHIATSLLIIAGFFQLSDGIQVAGLGILRGIADVNLPTLITLFAYWIIGLPTGYFLAFYGGMNVQGIWIGLLIGLTVSAILLTYRFYRLAFRFTGVSKQTFPREVG